MDESSFQEPSEFLTDEKPIKTTGTTCDAFLARYESRRVFVKRLKPEHASNSRYRWAFQKEYELGVSIKHQSIPQYIKFTGDTLITEFVDGKTLHQLIKEHDPRLHIESNVEKWVGQLLDAMDYLHARNVIHCDIKTDNVMITNDTRNLMLIDFDKAFTSSQDLTPGTPLNYGAEDETLTKRQMDIRGVRNIIEKLLQYVHSNSLKKRLDKVVEAAGSPEVTMPELLEIWKSTASLPDKRLNKNFRNISMSLGAVILFALLFIIWSYLPKESPEIVDAQEIKDSEDQITMSSNVEYDTTIDNPQENIKDRKPSISPDWGSLVSSDVEEMNDLLDNVWTEIQANNVVPDSVYSIVMRISEKMNVFNKEVLSRCTSEYPEISQDNLMTAIYNSEPVKMMVKRRDDILQRLIEIQDQ